MKNQYFGDIGDYGKYGLLRFLARHGVTVAVNWYLTPDDRSNDGNMRGYLGNEKDRVYDPELFDVLRDMCGRGEKDVRLFAARNMIGGAVFLTIPSGRCLPMRYHRQRTSGRPGNNGIGRRSKPAPERNSYFWTRITACGRADPPQGRTRPSSFTRRRRPPIMNGARM